MRTRAPSILTLLAATGTVAAADIVPAAGASTTSAVGSDANAPVVANLNDAPIMLVRFAKMGVR
jgi:hypothetical protein